MLPGVCRDCPFYYEIACVSPSFSSSSVAGYLDRPQVVQENTIFKRPSMVLLSVSVGNFVCPSSRNRRKPSLLASFGSVCGFPAVIATPHVHGVVPVFHALQRAEALQGCRFFFEILFSCSCDCVKHFPHLQLIVPSVECFKQVGH